MSDPVSPTPPVAPPPPPPAEPHLIAAAPAGAKKSSMWVEGAELHYVDPDGNDYAETGASVATPAGAKKGSIWVDTDDFIHYIDLTGGVERKISRTALAAAPAPSKVGSAWVDTAATAARRVYHRGSGTTKFQWWNGF